MADEVTVKVEGVEKALDKLKWYNVVIRDACQAALKKAGFAIETQAKDNLRAIVYSTPPSPHYKRTGRLLSSISTNWSGSGMSRGKTGPQAKSGDGIGQPSGPTGLVVVVGSAVDYSIFVEAGTCKMAERPYLYPAFFSKEGEVEKQIKEIVGQKIGK